VAYSRCHRFAFALTSGLRFDPSGGGGGAEVLAGISRALRSDGVFLMQDISGTRHHHTDVEIPLALLLCYTARK
jgi:hypothetical protein